MDRQSAGHSSRGLILAAAALPVAAFLLAATTARPPLRAARWIASDADLRTALGTLPTECLPLPKSREARWRVEVGRAAFRSTVLFGGQAGRAGLSCDACHRDGRTNPVFQFPGLSGAPGTADITSFLMSPKRGKDTPHYTPIPNLSGPKTALRIDQDPKRRDVEAFIHGIVTEEFDGREPPPAVLDGLGAYVRALSPQACPAMASEPQRVHDRLEDVRRALRAADGAVARRDHATAEVLIESARSQLGLIYERYAGLDRAQAELRASDAELGDLRRETRTKSRRVREYISEWVAGSASLETTLKRDEARSLYNPARL